MVFSGRTKHIGKEKGENRTVKQRTLSSEVKRINVLTGVQTLRSNTDKEVINKKFITHCDYQEGLKTYIRRRKRFQNFIPVHLSFTVPCLSVTDNTSPGVRSRSHPPSRRPRQ